MVTAQDAASLLTALEEKPKSLSCVPLQSCPDLPAQRFSRVVRAGLLGGGHGAFPKWGVHPNMDGLFHGKSCCNTHFRKPPYTGKIIPEYAIPLVIKHGWKIHGGLWLGTSLITIPLLLNIPVNDPNYVGILY